MNNPRVDRVVALVRQKDAHMLMPHMPIEIEAEGENIHLSCEGQWVFRVSEKMLYHKKDGNGFKRNSLDTEAMYKHLLMQTRKYLKDIVRCNAKFWSGEYPILYPEWSGWQCIDKETLKGVAGRAVAYDATLL